MSDKLLEEYAELEQRYARLERQYDEALRRERLMYHRRQSQKSWRRAGTVVQITLFFVGIAIGEWIVWIIRRMM